MTTPKLKPGAEKIIKAWLDSLEEVAPKECADKCRTAGHFSINWCLENLPKLLEATDISTPNSGDWDKMYEAKTGKIHFCHNFKPVAIVEVE